LSNLKKISTYFVNFCFYDVALALSFTSFLLQGYSTGLLGNTLLFSYFAAKKETGATIVQGVGMLSTYVLLSTVGLYFKLSGLGATCT
jgi:sensor histidine kinase YesM